ncbi:hypothetical protein BJV77DRAFT_1070920 [Russula vinacea]|nr:hypothetical protein BJV77DRAFT_1070920 [Russula vinacea]
MFQCIQLHLKLYGLGSATKAGTSSSATSSTKSNGATAVEQLPLLSAAIVIAGALMGGAFVL